MTRVVMTFPFALGTPGGGTQDAAELARALAEVGADVTLVTPDADGPGRFPRRRARESEEGRARAADLAAAGVELVASPPHPLHFRLDGRGVRAAVERRLAARGAEAVLGYWHEAFFLAEPARAHGALFAMTAAASFSQFFGPGRSGLERLRNARLARTYREAAVVFARSAFTCGELRAYLGLDPERLRVVPLGVERRFFDLPREARGPVRELVFVGRLVDSKGIFDALDALGRLARAGRRDWRLRAIGWGDPEPVRRAAAEHGIEGQVELLGGLDRRELALELGRAQLALLPSHTESFGLAVAEAQAAGLAVVGYAAGAVPEVVGDGETGWLAPTGRRDLLAEALASALDDPGRTLRAGLAGRERVRQRCSWRAAAERTLAGLTEAARGSGTGRAAGPPAG